MYKFIIAVNNLTSAQEDEFMEYLEDKGMGWWHRVDNFWMISTHDKTITTVTLRTALTNISKNTSIVMKVDKNEWAGFGLPDDFDWMKANWDK